MNPEILRKIQMKQLYIAKNIKKICDKYDIKYILNGGTLLGAIRHKGFIPWDDDLDIGMLREDYEKFLKIAKKELGDEFFVQNWDTEINYALPYTKIRLNNTTYIEYNSRNVDIHKGVFVDIFPYDNLSDNKIIQKFQKYLSKIYIHLLLNKCGYDYFNKDKKMIYLIFKYSSKIFSKEFLKKNLYNIMTKYNNINTKKVVNFGGSNNFSRETIDHYWIYDKIYVPFEDTVFLIPAEWDNFLTHFYGDYMILPPENKRYNRHDIIKFNLNN